MGAKHVYISLLLTSFLGSVAVSCSAPADRNILDYRRFLIHTGSLMQSGSADSTCTVRLLSDLHHKHTRMEELPEGKRARLMPATGWEHLLWGIFGCFMLGLNVWFSIHDIWSPDERKHHRYFIDLSESKQWLYNNERERAELEECLGEMSFIDEECREVQCSLTNLMNHGSRLCEENKQFRIHPKECEDRSVLRESELMMKESERARQLDGQVQTLTTALIGGDEVMEQLHSHSKFPTSVQWEYLQQLTDRVYKGASHRLVLRFPQLTPTDNQLCLLIRLGFSDAQIAAFAAISSSPISWQKSRPKKRVIQAEEELFAEGETPEMIVGSIPIKSR